jgi:1-acyl-sn-glycerol-3-phosphate acyltransferase
MTPIATRAAAAGATGEDTTGHRPGRANLQATPARRVWYALRPCWWNSYWKMEVQGLENHTSHLDAPAILAALPRGTSLRTWTAAASDVWDKPLRYRAARLTTNCLPLTRGGEFTGGLRRLDAALQAGDPLIIFPEGRRSVDNTLVEFKNGPAMLAMRNDCSIVPVHLSGCFDSLPRMALLPARATVRVRFGKPLQAAPYRLVVAAGYLDKRRAYAQLTADLKTSITQLARN